MEPAGRDVIESRARPLVVVTGADGQVGFEAVRAFAALGDVRALRRADLDVTDAGTVREAVRTLRPQVIVNAVAYNAVDAAESSESERARAFAVNAEAPRVLAEECGRLGALLVHYSTDYVFDGAKRSPYAESDEPAPLNVYGESKLAGERAVLASGARYLVVRTSWVHASRGRNFPLTMLRLARERDELRLVTDQTSVPTPARLVADTTAALVVAGALGVYHVAARGSATPFELATRVLALDPRPHEQRCRRIVPVPSAEYGAAARRPAYSVLGVDRVERVLGRAMPEWEPELRRTMDELRGG